MQTSLLGTPVTDENLNREFRAARAASPYDRYLTIEAQRPTGEWENSIHLPRANGSWQRWARLHHLNDQSDVEAAIQILQGVELG